MGIWQHTHTVTTTEVSPEFERAGWNLDDVSVEMIPLRHRWGCRTFQTASHIYVIHILGVWTPWTVVDGHLAAHSHRYHHRGIPRFGRAGWNLDDVSLEMIPLRLCSRHFVGTPTQTMVSAAPPSPNGPLGNRSMARYFRGTFHWCTGTILMLKKIHLIWV